MALTDDYMVVFEATGGTFARNPEPLQQTEIDAAEEILGVEIPDDVLALWKWSNGPAPQEYGAPPYCLYPEGGHLSTLLRSAETTAFLGERFAEAGRDLEPLPAIVVANCFEIWMVVVSLRESDHGSIWIWRDSGDQVFATGLTSFEEYLRLQMDWMNTQEYVFRHGSPGVLKRSEIPEPWRTGLSLEYR